MLGFVKSKIRQALFEGARPTFSQGSEDIILHNIFFRLREYQDRRGFYVDVGAHHPSTHSVTKLLHKNGWSGVNIDATPGSMRPFRRARPQDVNLEIGIAENEKTLSLNIIDGEAGMNSFSPQFVESQSAIDKIIHSVEVRCRPLSAVLDENAVPTDFDLLKIDVEGMDYEVLRSTDLGRYRPRVITIELEEKGLPPGHVGEVTQFLADNGYTLAARTIVAGAIGSSIYIENVFAERVFQTAEPNAGD